MFVLLIFVVRVHVRNQGPDHNYDPSLILKPKQKRKNKTTKLKQNQNKAKQTKLEEARKPQTTFLPRWGGGGRGEGGWGLPYETDGDVRRKF